MIPKTNARLEKRLEQDAEDILERDLCRRRWQAKDRDAIAARLQKIIVREHQKAEPREKT
jgi:hypothetical protein